MKTYTAYIVDDELLAIRALKKELDLFPEIELMGESTRMDKAIREIGSIKPEILFLDIQLVEGTGFDLLNKLDYYGKIVFITAFDEFAFRAFEINALDYLLKPICHKRFQETIERIIAPEYAPFHNSPPESVKYRYTDHVLVLERNQISFVHLEKIVMISAARDYTTIETLDGRKSLMMRSMADWVNRLPADQFIRIHRSYIVNINHIDRIIRNSTSSARVYLKNKSEPVSFSRSYYKILRDRFL
ncbi:MAG: response regulator transcription factor [Bacteroidales bacterium]|nr:response regulator transcription factor [Bacteroidales bacterium]